RTPGRAGAHLVVFAASAIEPEWLVDLFPHALREVEELRWDPAAERVCSARRLVYDELVLEERTGRPTDPVAAAGRLAEAALALGLDALVGGEALERGCARMEVSGLSPPDEATLRARLAAQCQGHSSLAELRALGPGAAGGPSGPVRLRPRARRRAGTR